MKKSFKEILKEECSRLERKKTGCKKKVNGISQIDRTINGAYCLLLGLEHDIHEMDKIPYLEKRYLLQRLSSIKSYLKSESVQ